MLINRPNVRVRSIEPYQLQNWNEAKISVQMFISEFSSIAITFVIGLPKPNLKLAPIRTALGMSLDTWAVDNFTSTIERSILLTKKNSFDIVRAAIANKT